VVLVQEDAKQLRDSSGPAQWTLASFRLNLTVLNCTLKGIKVPTDYSYNIKDNYQIFMTYLRKSNINTENIKHYTENIKHILRISNTILRTSNIY
jgi:Leucine-rich repeat (LRR) protein